MRSRSSSKSSIISIRSPPPLLVWIATHLDVACTCHLQASADRLWALHRVPESAAVTVTLSPPLFCPRPASMYMLAPGGVSHRGYFRTYVPPPRPHRFLFQILALSGPWSLVRLVFARGWEARRPPLPGSHSPWTSLTPLLGRAGTVQPPPTPSHGFNYLL